MGCICSRPCLPPPKSAVVLDVLSLIDIAFTGSLVVLVIFSGYENFVCRTDPARHATRPEWMTAIDFSGLKIKLLSSIVAITAIQTLRDYMDLDNRPDRSLAWSVGVHLTFVVSTVLLALERPHSRAPGQTRRSLAYSLR